MNKTHAAETGNSLYAWRLRHIVARGRRLKQEMHQAGTLVAAVRALKHALLCFLREGVDEQRARLPKLFTAFEVCTRLLVGLGPEVEDARRAFCLTARLLVSNMGRLQLMYEAVFATTMLALVDSSHAYVRDIQERLSCLFGDSVYDAPPDAGMHWLLRTALLCEYACLYRPAVAYLGRVQQSALVYASTTIMFRYHLRFCTDPTVLQLLGEYMCYGQTIRQREEAAMCVAQHVCNQSRRGLARQGVEWLFYHLQCLVYFGAFTRGRASQSPNRRLLERACARLGEVRDTLVLYKTLAAFAALCARRRAPAASGAPPPAGSECVVCMDQCARAAFVPCGHRACRACAQPSPRTRGARPPPSGHVAVSAVAGSNKAQNLSYSRRAADRGTVRPRRRAPLRERGEELFSRLDARRMPPWMRRTPSSARSVWCCREHRGRSASVFHHPVGASVSSTSSTTHARLSSRRAK